MRRKKMIFLVAGIILIIAVAGTAIWWSVSFSRSCNPPLPRAPIAVGSAQFDAELATTMAEQSCGLSGRAGLASDTGMLFIFGSAGTQNFWMKDMNFPIDMVWISGNAVAGFAENAMPQPGVPLWKLKIYSSPPGVDKVLEVPAGTVAARGIKIGDIVSGF